MKTLKSFLNGMFALAFGVMLFMVMTVPEYSDDAFQQSLLVVLCFYGMGRFINML